MDTTRCFVAVPIQPPASTQIIQLQKQLAKKLEQIRWVALDTVHITLKFVGDIPNLELPNVCQVISQACEQADAFSIGLDGLGVFPSPASPRVLWVGVEEGKTTLRELRKKMDQPMLDLGIPIEQRQFNPHLTLGRLLKGVDADQLAEMMERFGARASAEFVADRIVLYASLKHRGGYVYEPIHTVRLS